VCHNFLVTNSSIPQVICQSNCSIPKLYEQELTTSNIAINKNAPNTASAN